MVVQKIEKYNVNYKEADDNEERKRASFTKR